MIKSHYLLHKFLCTVAVAALPSVAMAQAQAPAAATANAAPTLVITNAPLPEVLQDKELYDSPRIAPDIRAQDILNEEYFTPRDTVASRKIEELRQELFNLQNSVSKLSENLNKVENQGQKKAAEYYSNVATIRTQLQVGTTPGNPRLVERLRDAQVSLESLSDHISDLNTLAVQITDTASLTSFLEQATRATYGLSGAVEEDHVKLSQLEDAISNTNVIIQRLLNNVNDDITRSAAYLSSERRNLRTLTAAISKGDLYGANLSNRPFSQAQDVSFVPQTGYEDYGSRRLSAPAIEAPKPQGRPLAVIKFDRSDVDYEQALYLAVSEALDRYPDTEFEIIAVEPGKGNSAQKAIESARSKRNAEKVLRTMTQFGVENEKLRLSSGANPDSLHNEVHVLIR